VRWRVVPDLMSTSRSSVAISSPPSDQVQRFCQMMLVCRSIPAARLKLRAS
jgi:hypothetical protein